MTNDRSGPERGPGVRSELATLADAVAAARDLESGAGSQDRYDLLKTIGEADAVEFRPLVESYLESPDDPMLARLALEILCDWWGLGRDYRDAVLRFVRGVEWDLLDGGYVRLVACTSAGEYLGGHADPELTRALLEVYDDGNTPDLVRGAVYAALARAQGQNWNEVPRAHRREWRFHVDQLVIERARGLATKHR